MQQLSKRIIKLLLKILGDSFDNKFYDPEFNNCNGYIRINKYSSRDTNKEVEGFGTHTDISCVTILFQDDVGGLQIRSKQGEWMDVRPIEDALVVNIGDFMQAWSNERLRSAEHKVILRQNIVERFSLAFFLTYGNDDDKEIVAPSEVVGEGNTRLYKPFSAREYRDFRENNYGKVTGVSLKEFAGIVS